jgi:hypothetical protein
MSSETVQVSEWIFERCDLQAPQAMALFDGFMRYRTSVRYLAFDGCHFLPKGGAFVFGDAFFFSKAFHQLEALWMSHVHLPDDLVGRFVRQLADSDWFVRSETMHSFVMIDCGISPGVECQKLERRHPDVVTLDFSENSFTGAPSAEFAKVLSSRAKLVIAKCGGADMAFAELFQALARHQGRSLSLDCGFLRASSSGWENLYAVHPELQLATLTELVWDGNAIDARTVSNFTAFLRNQPSLSSLSISDCVRQSNWAVVAPCFEGCRLASLTMRATTQPMRIGHPLVGFLKALFRQQTLRSLDITGQSIGHAGLLDAIKAMPLAIEEFWFEQNGIPSADAFFGIVGALFEPRRRWRFLSWPEADVKAVHQQVLRLHPDAAIRINQWKDRFPQVVSPMGAGRCSLESGGTHHSRPSASEGRWRPQVKKLWRSD